MARLKITNCKNHIEEITLPEGMHHIGRSLDSTLRLEGEEVSREHAKILVQKHHYELIDRNSKNGTFVNGSRIKSSLLKSGDIIQIGRFKLQFLSDSAKPHYPEIFHLKKTKTKKALIISAVLLLFFSSYIIYQASVIKKNKILLAERTAQFLAEKYKESLYLGEYDSIMLNNLPLNIKKAAILDRKGVIRASYPLGEEPEIGNTSSPCTQGLDTSPGIKHIGRNTLLINMPITCESVQVGTLWMIYRL